MYNTIHYFKGICQGATKVELAAGEDKMRLYFLFHGFIIVCLCIVYLLISICKVSINDFMNNLENRFGYKMMNIDL